MNKTNTKEGTYMSDLNYITEMLELKDKNIKFFENCYRCILKNEVHNCCALRFITGIIHFKQFICH